MNAFGLQNKEMIFLIDVFRKYEGVNLVLIYGSRAKGNFTERSDVDLVIINSTIDRHTIGAILMEINNSDFPYLVDLQSITTIKNTQLVEHINRMGQVFFMR